MANETAQNDHVLTTSQPDIATQVEAHAEAIMRAAGSSLRHYSMPGNRRRILAAVMDCYEQAYRTGADRAIVAAPALYEALEGILPRMGQADHLPDDAVIPVDMTMAEIRKARAALAQARGGV